MKEGRKRSVHATVSPLAERQLKALTESHHLFSSRSDAVEKAISMLFYAAMHPQLGLCADECGIFLHSAHAGKTVGVI